MVWQKAIAFSRKFYRQISMKTIKVGLFWLLICCLIGCQRLNINNFDNSDRLNNSLAANNLNSDLAEVATPKIIKDLSPSLDRYYPQVKIVTPKSEQTIDHTEVRVELEVEDLPLFQDQKWGLGNHLNLIVDNEPFQPIYNIDRPITIENLAPGSHTIRAFAVSSWGESFKNEGAYAQTTFNVLTETNDNRPDPTVPLLTYNSPTGTYGAEPMLLDFYLTNAPLHEIAQNNNNITDWRIKATIDGTSFIIDNWQPIYLTGLKPGDNWVQLELIDEQGNDIENVFNNTVRVINYDPQQQDSLAKLLSNAIPLVQAKSLVDPDYILPEDEPQIIEPNIETEPTVTVEKPLDIAQSLAQLEQPMLEAEIELEAIASSKSETTINPTPTETTVEKLPDETEKVILDDTEIKNELETAEQQETTAIAQTNSVDLPTSTVEIPQPESVEITEPEIIITIPETKPTTISQPKTDSKTPSWLKKILVGLRQKLEGLVKLLPSEV